MNNTILNTNFIPPLTVISNGVITGSPWTNPNNIFYVDSQVCSSVQGAGVASDMIIGNFNVDIPTNAIITGIQMQLIAEYSALTSPIATITPYFVDNTSGQNIYYPGDVFTGLTPDLATYILGGQNYQFNTALTVDQVNNIKIALVASGGINVDSFLVQVFYYIPSPITPPPTVPTDNCIDCNSPVQINAMYLALPFLVGQTVFYLQPNSLQYPDGTPFAPGDVGGCGGEVNLVFDQGKAQVNGSNFAENAVMPFIEGDSMDSATITILSNGVQAIDIKNITNRGLSFHTPYTYDSDLQSNHAANSEVVISNSGRFYLRFVRTCQVGVVFSAPITVEENSSVIADPVTDFNFIGGGVTVVQDISNPEKVNITIPGAGGTTPPIIVSSSSATSDNIAVSSLAWDHVSSGLNRLLVVQTAVQGATVTGITYNGVALTYAVSKVTGALDTEQWYLIAPPVGTYPIIVTLSATAYVTCGAETYAQTNQSVPIGVTSTATGTNGTPILNLITGTDNSLVVDSLATDILPIVYFAGAGQSVNWDLTENPDVVQGASSLQPAGAQPDTVTMQWTTTQPGAVWVQTALEIKGITTQVPGVTQIVAGTNVTISPSGGTGIVTINAAGGGGSILLETNGTPNASQSVLNLIAGSNTTITDGGSGNITIASTGTGSSGQVSNSETAGMDFTGATQPVPIIFGDGSNLGFNLSTGNTNQHVGSTSSNVKTANKFVPTFTMPCNESFVNIQTIGTPSDQTKVSIQTDNAGAPSGTILASEILTISEGSFTNVAFSWSTITLTAGVVYWVVIERTGSPDPSNYQEISATIGVSNRSSAVFNGSGWSPISSSGNPTLISLLPSVFFTAGEVFAASSSANIFVYGAYDGFPGMGVNSSALLQSCDGVVLQTISGGSSINVISDGVFTVTGSALTAGDNYFVSATSTLATSGSIKVGRALVGGTTFFIRRY